MGTWKFIDWDNLDWSKFDEREKEMYSRLHREGRKQVAWKWIKLLAIAIPVLFIFACTANVVSEPDPYPEFCMKVQSWERNNFCNVLYD